MAMSVTPDGSQGRPAGGSDPRDWARPLFRCPACRAADLRADAGALRCAACGAQLPVSGGIVDFLVDPHPVVARERGAVTRLDGDERVGERLAERLGRLEAGTLLPSDLQEFPCLRHAAQSREQLRDVLARYPLTAGEVVLEMGADHCWASSLFLDAGCRVIALDITNHLRLAPRGGDPSLCRINADMNDVPLGDGSVDVVWATAAAHHSWSLERTFAEAARVLRPGGRLYFCCEPMPSWLRYPFGRDFGHAEKELGINETWLPRSRWLRAAAGAGLAPRLVFPVMDRRTVEDRLRSHHLPPFLAPLAPPFLRVLQVSIHLLASKA